MGLDIYLYRYNTPYEEVERVENEYEKLSEENWARLSGGVEYDKIPAETKQQIRELNDELKIKLGLTGEYGSHPGKEKIELDSAKYPDHMFKIGYCRSSYNSGGFDSAMGTMINITLYDLFGKEEDAYVFKPDWEETAARARGAIERYDLVIKEDGAAFQVMEVDEAMSDTGIKSKDDALKIFREQLREHRGRDKKGGPFDFSSFSNYRGEWILGDEPLRVRALLKGTSTFFGREATYVVYESEGLVWYRQSMEIVVEMCEWVLAQPDKEKFYVHWSG